MDRQCSEPSSRLQAKQFTFRSQTPLCRWRRRQALPVHAHHQPLPLLGAHLPAGVAGLRPGELALVQPPQAHPYAGAIPAHDLEPGTAAIAEDVRRAIARCPSQCLLHMQRQSIDAGAHVHRRHSQPDRIGLQPQRSPDSTAASQPGSVSVATRSTHPDGPRNSIVDGVADDTCTRTGSSCGPIDSRSTRRAQYVKRERLLLTAEHVRHDFKQMGRES